MHDLLLRVGAAAVLVFSACATSEAAPVTFAFESKLDFALLDPAAGAIPPLPFAAGDIVKGSFSFDPDVPVTTAGNPSTTIYMAKLQIKLEDFEILTDSFSIEVFDDSLTIGTIEYPDGPQVFEDFDAIILGCSPSLPAGCQPEITEVPGVGLFRVSLELRLLGDLSVLESTEVPGSVNLWNNLDSFRSISLSFDAVEPNTSTVFYGATLGGLVVVPEPSSFIVLMSFLVILLVFRRSIYCKLNC